jgi:hypothetical protein
VLAWRAMSGSMKTSVRLTRLLARRAAFQFVLLFGCHLGVASRFQIITRQACRGCGPQFYARARGCRRVQQAAQGDGRASQRAKTGLLNVEMRRQATLRCTLAKHFGTIDGRDKHTCARRGDCLLDLHRPPSRGSGVDLRKFAEVYPRQKIRSHPTAVPCVQQ